MDRDRLNILFGIPLLYSSILGAADVITLLALTGNRFRVIEYFFMVFVSIISIGFLYELLIVPSNPQLIVIHSISPMVTSKTVLLVVGIVGATVMPHALWLHSSLTQAKAERWGIDESDLGPKKKLLRLHLRETVIILSIAGCVNAAILIMGAGLYPHTISGIGDAYRVLTPLFGATAAAVFALTLLASGIASSTVGTLAGQEVMTAMIGTKVNK